MNNKTFLITGACAAALICAPLVTFAAEKKSAAKEEASPAASPAAKQRAFPFNGTVSEVDQSAKTFTLTGKKPRVFKITDKTQITKEGKTASLTDIAANQKVSGSYWKQADNSLEAKMVNIGAMSEKKTEKESKKSKKTKDSDSSEASPSPSPKS